MTSTPQQTYRPAGRNPSAKGVYLLVLAGAIVLYGLTAQRGIGWQDSGDFQWRVLKGCYADFTGLARAHPLYIALGRLLGRIPFGEITTKLNLFSGLAMAVALANLAGATVRLTGRRWIGLATAGMLAVCHTVWWLSTIAEVYTLSVAGLTAEVWLLIAMVRRPNATTLAGLALVNGLGVCVHNFALLPLPVYVVVAVALAVRRKLPWWSIPAAAGVWIMGASLYIGFIVGMAADTGDVIGAVRSALVGNYGGQVFHAGAGGRLLRANLALASLNFMSFLLPLAVVGLFRFRKVIGGPLAAALGAVTLIELLFAARYPVPDQFTFLLPTLTMVALAAGVGLSVLADASRAWKRFAVAAAIASLVLPPAGYLGALATLRASGFRADRARQLPYRDELRYWLLPWKQDEHSAERFARAALDRAAPDGVIVADATSQHTLRLMQALRGVAPSVAAPLLEEGGGDHMRPFGGDAAAFRRHYAGHAIFVVSPVAGHCPRELLDAATFTPVSDERGNVVLHRLHWKP